VGALIEVRPRRLVAALLASGLTPVSHDPGELRDRARELLSRPPYRDGGDGPVTDVLRRIREAIARVVEAVLETVAGDTRVAWVIVAVGTAILLTVVWRATRGWDGERAAAAVPPASNSRTAGSWADEAADHVAAGRWHEAVRCRYAGLVTLLIERGALADVPGRTVGELDREVAVTAPGIAADVARAGDVFEDVWYGHGEAGPDELAVVAAAVDASDELLPARTGARA
jgi:hypothetical protein